MGPLLISEALFGFLSAILAFIAMRSYSGGKLSSSIKFIAFGAILMSAGHIMMAIDLLYKIDIFMMLFGDIGAILFRIIVAISLGSTLTGFYKLWRLSAS